MTEALPLVQPQTVSNIRRKAISERRACHLHYVISNVLS